MYESHFGLTARPFPEVPHADYYFPAESLEQARTAIMRCLTRGAGAALILGAPGSGKTMLCERLASDLQNQFPIANLNWGHPTSRRGLLQAILYKLDLPYRNLDEGELRLALVDHLTRSPNCPHGIVLIVDEAHLMPADLLEEIRILTNVVANREPRVRLVLAGPIGLEENLAQPRMQSLQQRIATRCQIVNFRREETRAYLRQAIARCGGLPGKLIGERAADMVHDLTHGTPRLINQLCDHACIMACINGDSAVSADLMHEAWSDLQQLPISLDAYRPASSLKRHEDVIEFGNLEDSPPFIPFPSATSESELSDLPNVGVGEILSTNGTAPIDEKPSLTAEPSASGEPAPEPWTLELPSGGAFGTSSHLFGDQFVEQETVMDRYTERARAARRIVTAAEPPPSALREVSAVEFPVAESPGDAAPTRSTDPNSTASPAMVTIDWTQSIDLSEVSSMLASMDMTAVTSPITAREDDLSEEVRHPLQEPEVATPAEVSDDLPAYELADWDTVSQATVTHPDAAPSEASDGVDDLLEEVTDLLNDRPALEEEQESVATTNPPYELGRWIRGVSSHDAPPAATPKRNLKSLFSQLEAKATEPRS